MGVIILHQINSAMFDFVIILNSMSDGVVVVVHINPLVTRNCQTFTYLTI